MISRRAAMSLIALAGLLATAPGFAAEKAAFDWPAFNAAAAEGRPILIEVSAVWCPTCRRQKPVIAELLTLPEFGDLVVLEIDFDTKKDILRRFGVQQQATLLVFKGETEVGRAVGITKRGAIFDLVRRAL
jgi:thiol-disulfide isomerase/thioredoxin